MTRFKKVAYVIPCIILISVIIFYPPFKGTSYRWYKNNELEQITTETCNVGEYIPSIYGDNFQFLHEHMYQFMQKGIEIKEKDNYLNILNANELKFEALQVNLEASFNNVSEVILPITYSGLSRLYKIYPNTNLKHQIPIWRTDSDPRIRAILPFGQYKLQLDLPTLKNIFIPKKKPYNRDRFEVIECDAEQLSPFGTFLVSKCGFHFFQNAECRSNEKAHSGKYSVKLIGNNSFGFTYKMNSLKDYLTDWEVSVWRYGNDKGTLIIQIGDKIFMSQNKSSEVDANGWELLKIRFKIPPQISEDDEIKFYVYNSLDKNPIYFDDFKLEAVEKKNTVWATTKAKTEPKTVEYFIQSINHNTNWLNLIKKETAKKNIPLDSLIKLNAIWMVQNQ